MPHRRTILPSRSCVEYSDSSPSAAAVAAGFAAIVTIGILSGGNDGYVSYSFGQKTTDSELVMESVNNSLTDFFAEKSRAEASLAEIFGK